MYVHTSLAPGGVDTIVYTLMINGIATALTVTLTGANVTGADLVNIVQVAQGDTYSVRSVTSAGVANQTSGVTFEFF